MHKPSGGAKHIGYLKDEARIYIAPPLQDTIAAYERSIETVIRLTAGKPENLLESIALRKNGDVISCGAEYVHDEAEDRDLLIKGTRKSPGLDVV